RITGVAGANNDLQQIVPLVLESGVSVTASVRFKAPQGALGQLFFGDTANAVTPWTDVRTIRDGEGVGEHVQKMGNGDWQTLAITVTPSGVPLSDRDALRVLLYAPEGTPVTYDEAQVEVGSRVTPFHEGYVPDAPKRYMKVASPDLRCDDFHPDGSRNTANDRPECALFAAVCTADDVGCERFTPIDGSSVIAGRYLDADRCPAACVGYAAFREEPSTYDAHDGFDALIPSTARQCSTADIGCAAFTNLEAAAAGGESREQFTFLRLCEKPGTVSSATYYVWEGSQERGYQLLSFVLRTSVEGAGGAASPPWTSSCTGGNCAADSCDAQYAKHVGDAGYDSGRLRQKHVVHVHDLRQPCRR
ncbi:MAG: hypothetical protein Q7S02_04935, partial [bacterium]|nr:hypothetical protein [bacterium]